MVVSVQLSNALYELLDPILQQGGRTSKLDLSPTFSDMNHLISLVPCGISAGGRFESGDCMKQMNINLVPFPKINIVTSFPSKLDEFSVIVWDCSCDRTTLSQQLTRSHQPAYSHHGSLPQQFRALRHWHLRRKIHCRLSNVQGKCSHAIQQPQICNIVADRFSHSWKAEKIPNFQI